MCENPNTQKQPLPEDMVHPVTHNTTNATALPDYTAQGLDRYEVAPDDEIPDLPQNQTAGMEKPKAARPQRPAYDATLEE